MNTTAGLLSALLLIAGCIFPAETRAQNEESALTALLREAADESVLFVQPGSARLRVFPVNAHPAVRQVFSEALMKRQIGVVTGNGPAGSTLTVDIRGMNSSTVLLDNSSYLRTVSVQAGVVVEQTKADSIVWSREYTLSRTDTLDGIPPYIERDIMTAEPESWFDAVITPVVAIAATVIIVVLLFTIRGS